MAKLCWYCGKDTLEETDFGERRKGWRCRSCGATDVDPIVVVGVFAASPKLDGSPRRQGHKKREEVTP